MSIKTTSFFSNQINNVLWALKTSIWGLVSHSVVKSVITITILVKWLIYLAFLWFKSALKGFVENICIMHSSHVVNLDSQCFLHVLVSPPQPECSLHLHVQSENGLQSILTQDSAIGLIMAQGNTGPSLTDRLSDVRSL